MVRVLAAGVDEADLACSKRADRLDDLALADTCADARRRAKAALMAAGLGVDAYDDGKAGEVACATRTGYLAALEMADAMGAGNVPSALSDAIDMFGFYMGGLCNDGRKVVSDAG